MTYSGRSSQVPKHIHNNNEHSRVCAIISTYRPDDEFPKRVDLVSQQVSSVIIVNDSASLVIDHLLFQWFKQNNAISNLILHKNYNNIGIGASLNVGLTIAIERGFEHFLLLDDDTTVMPNLVNRLIYYKILINQQSKKPVGIIAMSSVPIGGTLETFHSYAEKWQDKRGVITSGSFFDKYLVNAIGYLREDFIIDSVDYDFCLRARKSGFRVIKISEPGFYHTVGQNLGRNDFDENLYKYRRIYYGIRNGTVLAKEYLFSDPLYSCAVAIAQLKTIYKSLFTGTVKSRKKKIKMIVHAYYDAVFNKMGKRK
jgi:rhamnosyltransferase